LQSVKWIRTIVNDFFKAAIVTFYPVIHVISLGVKFVSE
jgi:hypothetical protein